jgi:hypothetical protein
MNFFEKELRRIAKACNEIINPKFAGRVCYGELGGDNRVKLQFVTHGTMDRYEAVKVTILNRTDGEVDSLLLRFSDTWGKKQVSNPNFSSGIIPYIWTDRGDSDWYVYHPTDADIKKLAAELNTYLGVFADRSLAPEKTKEQTSSKESVIKQIRAAKGTAADRPANAVKPKGSER